RVPGPRRAPVTGRAGPRARPRGSGASAAHRSPARPARARPRGSGPVSTPAGRPALAKPGCPGSRAEGGARRSPRCLAEVHVRPVLVELTAVVAVRGLYITEPEFADLDKAVDRWAGSGMPVIRAALRGARRLPNAFSRGPCVS